MIYLKLYRPIASKLDNKYFSYFDLIVRSPMGYWWFARSRYCMLICCSIGLVMLLININFIFFRQRYSRDLTSSQITNFFSSNGTVQLRINSSEYGEFNVINEFWFQASASTNIIINLTHAIAMPNQSKVKNDENGLSRYETIIENTECEAEFAGIQWTLWNLVDLIVSSLGPFAIILALNLAIIIRISARNRTTYTHQNPIVLRDGVRVALSPESEPQHMRDYILSRDQVAANNSKAERSVTLMLLVTTFAFVVMRSPIAVGHSLQMLLTEEKLFALIEPVTCMAAFAVAEMLAFGQHAIQFYVYFACSARFRQALLRQFDSVLNRLGRFFTRLDTRPPDPEIRNTHSLEQHRLPASCQYPEVFRRWPHSSGECHHAFMWIDPHVLLCRRCLLERVVHHPSCAHFREEQRFECECLLSSVEHPAHLVVHLGDRQSPFFGL